MLEVYSINILCENVKLCWSVCGTGACLEFLGSKADTSGLLIYYREQDH